MMTVQDIQSTLKLLTANYGEEFYKGTNEADVLKLWSVQFSNDDPKEVVLAVNNCIATMSYKPRIADIRKRMAQAKMEGQPTATEAFEMISRAVDSAYDRGSATKAFNDFPPIVRKVVGNATRLVKWHHVSDEAFETVVMSAIRESYRELAQREADYYALPKPLQAMESWRIEAPTQEALPEPEATKTIAEVIAEANAKSAEHGMHMTAELKEKHSGRVDAFLSPMSDDEKKAIRANG